MILQLAKEQAEHTLCFFKPYVKRIEVVGSIRRECAEVNDLDIILIPNENFSTAIEGLKPYIKKQGDKLIMYEINSIKYDIYICTEENWEVIKLIRTGSANHNKMLCSIAIKQGLHLKAGGEGLVDNQGKVISNTEEGILRILLNKYVEPKER